jgi:LPS-assembly protein
MKNNIQKILYYIFLLFLFSANAYGNQEFIFNITEVEIKEEGNKFIGLNKGTATSNDGIIINANTFEYIKNSNILNAKGDVEIIDTVKNYIIYGDDVTYFKNEEIILTKGNAKAIDNKGSQIYANTFEYKKNLNILNAKGDVEIIDTVKNYIIYADDVTYFKNQEKIITIGDTKAIIESKYNFKSKNVTLLRNKMELSSSENTNIKDDKLQVYSLSNFKYLINDEKLRGENVIIITNYNLPNSDKFYFSNGNFNLRNNSFLAKNTEITIHKNIFDDPENDPRIYGVSSSGNEQKTIINKGVFTSCKKTDKKSPWCIKADKITHDKEKKQLLYDKATLKIYDIPVLYFPKFFHPDPTVKRQSGFLKPQISNSDNLGTSFNTPYFYAISESRDFTFKPTFFDDDKLSLFNEYRIRTKKSSLDVDFGINFNYQSNLEKKKKNFYHLFADFKHDLKWENFNSSSIESKIQRVNNDTYLKLYDSIIQTPLKPNNKNQLENNLILKMETDSKDLEAGINIFEDLNKTNSDRYQFVLPYYNFYSDFNTDKIQSGYLEFSSIGKNNLINTNNLQTKIINDLNFKSYDFISRHGFSNNYGMYLKNLNTSAKNDSTYKSSPQAEVKTLFEFQSKFPLEKKLKNYNETLTPRISFKISPQSMSDFSETDRNINVNNIFETNRLGINETYESGRSLTIGADYKRQFMDGSNKYIEFRIGSSFRDKEESNIPKSSTLNRKSSNIFGSFINNYFSNPNVDEDIIDKNSLYSTMKYDFAVDNDLKSIEYSSLNLGFQINNFETNFIFIEKNGEMGDVNTIENTTSYEFSDNNFISLNTRRNRKIDLTEYYDLIYEYKNDCLTAGLKYKKTFYQDRDLKPREDLMLTLTIIPLTTYEQEIDQSFYRD